jgi:hypothetical protein
MATAIQLVMTAVLNFKSAFGCKGMHKYSFYIKIEIPILLCINAPYFVILLCLMPDNFTCQGEILPLNGLKLNLACTKWLEMTNLHNFTRLQVA